MNNLGRIPLRTVPLMVPGDRGHLALLDKDRSNLSVHGIRMDQARDLRPAARLAPGNVDEQK